MKVKKEYILAALLIAASLVYLMVHKDSRINYRLPELAGLDQSAVTTITIKRSDETLELTRDQEIWWLEGRKYKADQMLVQSLLNSSDFIIQDLITEREDYDRYDLQPESALQVILSSENGTLREFFVGKKSSSGIYTYIRLPGEKGIFSVQKDLTSKVKLPIQDWRSRQVMDFAADEATKIEISGSEVISLEKIMKDDETFWTRNDETAVGDSKEIEQQLSALSTLKAVGFPESGNTAAPPEATVTVTTHSGVHELMILEKQEAGYSVRSSDEPGDFIIPVTAGDAILSFASSGE